MTLPRPPEGSPTVAPGTVRPSTQENPQAQPLIAPTGSVTVNALAHVVNQAAAPFTDPPPANEGTVQAVSRNVSGALGVVGAAFSLADTGMALATAKVAALAPALPAVTLGCMYMGPPHCHAHPPSLIPPAPTPVPLPSLGSIMVAGCVSVLISGVPAARCGDYGLAPTCGGFMPIFEVKTGSSQVFIGGSRAARLMDFAKACPGPPEPPGPPKPPSRMAQAMAGLGAAGVGAGALAAAANSSAMIAAQTAADAAALAMGMLYGRDPSVPPAIASMGVVMPMQGTVLIGGFPMPDTLTAITGLLKGVRVLAKGLRGGRRGGKLFCLRC